MGEYGCEYSWPVSNILIQGACGIEIEDEDQNHEGGKKGVEPCDRKKRLNDLPIARHPRFLEEEPCKAFVSL